MQPKDGRDLQQILEMLSKLDPLADLRATSPLKMERLEKLYMKLRYVCSSVTSGVKAEPKMIPAGFELLY